MLAIFIACEVRQWVANFAGQWQTSSRLSLVLNQTEKIQKSCKSSTGLWMHCTNMSHESCKSRKGLWLHCTNMNLVKAEHDSECNVPTSIFYKQKMTLNAMYQHESTYCLSLIQNRPIWPRGYKIPPWKPVTWHAKHDVMLMKLFVSYGFNIGSVCNCKVIRVMTMVNLKVRFEVRFTVKLYFFKLKNHCSLIYQSRAFKRARTRNGSSNFVFRSNLANYLIMLN